MATRCSSFELAGTCASARTGVLRLPHGDVRTPAFMPVGTRGTVRGMSPSDLVDAGTEMLLCNTYHLWVRPGVENLVRRGGLHRFTAWNRPILTDSGGYQVFSLREHTRVAEAGVTFRSPEDGEYRHLSPEIAVSVQEDMGVDVAMALDECLEWPATRDRAAESTARTTRWLKRCVAARRSPDRTALFGIVQGGVYPDLRADHAREIAALDLDGYAVGGLSVGEDRDTLLAMAAIAAAELPSDRPRYLMGVGHPVDIADAVIAGIDLFDCVLPTRAGRHGQAYTSVGRRNLKNARYAEDDGPLDPSCGCATCRQYSLAWLRHLTRCDEILGKIALTFHNLHYYHALMGRLRGAIGARDPDAVRSIRAEAAVASALVVG